MELTDALAVYAGRRVLVTGHTGFKGSWLSLWLHELNASVTGLALPPETHPSLFTAAGVDGLIDSLTGDINDLSTVTDAVTHARPEVIFHLAAQPLVRRGYREPLTTFATNVMGTLHVLEAARRQPGCIELFRLQVRGPVLAEGRAVGSRGAAVECLSAIDIALWDIRGKVLGQPIYELLGGAVRDEVALYTHPDQSKFTSNEGVVAEIKAIVAQSQKRSAVYDMVTNGVPVAVEVATA